MQKIIFDTNVIVSAIIQKSFLYLILTELYLERKIRLCVSEDLMAEYYEVLNRDKFLRFPDFRAKAHSILADIEINASRFSPKNKVRVIKDVDDNMLLELAQECNADFLITGNTNDFTIDHFEITKILSPRAYWEL